MLYCYIRSHLSLSLSLSFPKALLQPSPAMVRYDYGLVDDQSRHWAAPCLQYLGKRENSVMFRKKWSISAFC